MLFIWLGGNQVELVDVHVGDAKDKDLSLCLQGDGRLGDRVEALPIGKDNCDGVCRAAVACLLCEDGRSHKVKRAARGSGLANERNRLDVLHDCVLVKGRLEVEVQHRVCGVGDDGHAGEVLSDVQPCNEGSGKVFHFLPVSGLNARGRVEDEHEVDSVVVQRAWRGTLGCRVARERASRSCVPRVRGCCGATLSACGCCVARCG